MRCAFFCKCFGRCFALGRQAIGWLLSLRSLAQGGNGKGNSNNKAARSEQRSDNSGNSGKGAKSGKGKARQGSSADSKPRQVTLGDYMFDDDGSLGGGDQQQQPSVNLPELQRALKIASEQGFVTGEVVFIGLDSDMQAETVEPATQSTSEGSDSAGPQDVDAIPDSYQERRRLENRVNNARQKWNKAVKAHHVVHTAQLELREQLAKQDELVKEAFEWMESRKQQVTQAENELEAFRASRQPDVQAIKNEPSEVVQPDRAQPVWADLQAKFMDILGRAAPQVAHGAEVQGAISQAIQAAAALLPQPAAMALPVEPPKDGAATPIQALEHHHPWDLDNDNYDSFDELDGGLDSPSDEDMPEPARKEARARRVAASIEARKARRVSNAEITGSKGRSTLKSHLKQGGPAKEKDDEKDAPEAQPQL
jgi:hypothetical protein